MTYEILVTRRELEEIAETFILSYHASKRLKERANSKDVKQMILNSPLCWRTRDGFINIATDNQHFLVVGEGNQIITYQDKSKHGYTVVDKFTMSYFGLERTSNNKKNKGEICRQAFLEKEIKHQNHKEVKQENKFKKRRM